MTKKDYEIVAAAFNKEWVKRYTDEQTAALRGLNLTLAEAFQKDNENFNPVIWFKETYKEPALK